jgi:hypothetical protein
LFAHFKVLVGTKGGKLPVKYVMLRLEKVVIWLIFALAYRSGGEKLPQSSYR